MDLEPRIGTYHFTRGRARRHLGTDEATLRAALADLDGAAARGYDDADLFAVRARVHALLDNDEAAGADRARAGDEVDDDEDEEEEEPGPAGDEEDQPRKPGRCRAEGP